MTEYPNTSNRLKDYDYSSSATYFVTICLSQRSDLFGHVADTGTLVQSDVGNMIAIKLLSISDEFPVATISDFIVMPDHIHALIGIDQNDENLSKPTLGQLIGWFKGVTRHRYSQGVATREWPRYNGKFWQPGFHDHIIRDERDHANRTKYIERNPIRWAEKRQGEMF